MRNSAPGRLLLLFAFLSAFTTGCGKDRPANLLGRWYSSDVSIRFRANGSVLYNSRDTGLVEGRYEYEPAFTSLAQANPRKNLTLWLPQPGRVAVMPFALQFLGNNRIAMKPIVDKSSRSELGNLMAATGVVLKRASSEKEGTDGLEGTPPLVSANPNNQNNPESATSN